jgi:hypothetical protein
MVVTLNNNAIIMPEKITKGLDYNEIIGIRSMKSGG